MSRGVSDRWNWRSNQTRRSMEEEDLPVCERIVRKFSPPCHDQDFVFPMISNVCTFECDIDKEFDWTATDIDPFDEDTFWTNEPTAKRSPSKWTRRCSPGIATIIRDERWSMRCELDETTVGEVRMHWEFHIGSTDDWYSGREAHHLNDPSFTGEQGRDEEDEMDENRWSIDLACRVWNVSIYKE